MEFLGVPLLQSLHQTSVIFWDLRKRVFLRVTLLFVLCVCVSVCVYNVCVCVCVYAGLSLPSNIIAG